MMPSVISLVTARSETDLAGSPLWDAHFAASYSLVVASLVEGLRYLSRKSQIA